MEAKQVQKWPIKHIAVIGIPSGDGKTYVSLARYWMEGRIGPGSMVIYPNAADAAAAIRNKLVLGVVVLNVKSDADAVGLVRDALEDVDWLPVRALPQSAQDSRCLTRISGVVKGPSNQIEEFLKHAMEPGRGTLEERMRVPKKELKVVIMDDESLAARGMLKLLKEWKNIKVEFVEQKGEEMHLMPEADIVLLDHDMGNINGAMIAIKLKMDGFQGIVASTSGGRCPDYTELHFDGKDRMQREGETGNEGRILFVKFMNGLIGLAECPEQ